MARSAVVRTGRDVVGKPMRKQKKTLSLSPEAVSFLERTRKQDRKSTSAIVEELIQAKKLAAEQERISQGIRHYYDSLDVEQQAENRIWGRFSESQFPGE